MNLRSNLLAICLLLGGSGKVAGEEAYQTRKGTIVHNLHRSSVDPSLAQRQIQYHKNHEQRNWEPIEAV